MTLDKNIIVEIDKILSNGLNDRTIPVHSSNKNISKALLICKALDFITHKSNSEHELKEKAILAIQDGGIENYLNNLRLDRDLEKTIKDLTKKSLENEVKNNLKYVAVGGFLGIIASIVAVVLTSVMQSEGKEERKQLNKQSYDMRVEQNHLQTDLQQMRSDITSLEKKVDSLKTASE
tara:strand:+ start:74 stop:607 length:534 start_codon:yes stop_codon:yes gene_type:complete